MTDWLESLRRGVDREAVIRGFVIASAAGVFLALIGPFGTAQSALWARMVYWLTLCIGGTALGILTSVVVGSLLDPQDKRPFVIAAACAVVMTPPATLGVYAATRWMFALEGTPGTLLGFAGPVLLVSLAMTYINALADRRPVQTHANPTPGAPPSRFADRLPPKLWGAEIHAVEAEDHYLRLHTSKGSDLILLRLSDAIAELEGVEGAQTHRSWWVARGAVCAARRIEGRAVLELPGGVEAPVSRNYVRALKGAGWF